MKKHYSIALLILLLSTTVRAAIDTVTVTNFQFSPANMPDVIVGDTIRYYFTDGFHNAVSTGIANALPAGAAAINSGAASSNNPRTYDYIVTKAGGYKYLCEIHATASTFSGMVGTFTASNALPATLKDFSLTTSKDKPLFTWTTLTEVNVSHFSIRASYDGFKYAEVGRVEANNAANGHTYSFVDNNVPKKYTYVYYLLATVDQDGHESLSKVKVFKNPVGTSKIITQIGPNPLKRPEQLMIQFNSDKEGKLQARVFDAAGKLALTTSLTAFAGLNNAHLHLCDLNAGTYTIQFTLDGNKETKKVVVY